MYSYMHIYLIENVKNKIVTVLFAENNVSFVDICSLISIFKSTIWFFMLLLLFIQNISTYFSFNIIPISFCFPSFFSCKKP